MGMFQPVLLLVVHLLHQAVASPTPQPSSLPHPSLQPDPDATTTLPVTNTTTTGGPPVLPPLFPLLHNPSCLKEPTSGCASFSNVTCFGTPLPHDSFSFELSGLNRIWEVQSALREWTVLQNVPKCWPLLQSLLCAVYLPKCDAHAQRVELPSRQLCRVTRGPCRIVREWDGWPEFLQCNNSEVYKDGCGIRLGSDGSRNKEVLKFDTLEPTCPPTLVPTERDASFFHSYDGCALPCQSPLYTDENQSHLVGIIRYTSGFGTLLFFLIVATLAFPSKKRAEPGGRSYPSAIILYMSICFLAVNLTLLLPSLLSEFRRATVCEDDGSRRLQASGSGNHACTAIFFALYFFSLSFCIWFCILSYCWHSKIVQSPGTSPCWAGKTAYFHMLAWIVPFVAAVLLVSLNVVEGESLTGVCVVSGGRLIYQGLAIVLPLMVALVFSGFYNFQTIKKFKEFLSPESTSSSSSTVDAKEKEDKSVSSNSTKTKTFRKYGFKIGLTFVVFYLIALFTIFHVFQAWSKRGTYDDALKDRIHCLAKKQALSLESYVSDCQLKERPSLALVTLQLLCLLFGSLTVLVWMSPKETLAIWKERFSREKKDDVPADKQHKFKKHHVVKQVYLHRRRLQETGRLSLSLQSLSSLQPQAVDMRIMQHQSSSGEELSSAFVAGIPRLMQRRGAVPDIEDQYNQFFQRKDSVDSRSVSVYQLQRQDSVGSQLSLQTAEMNYLSYLQTKDDKKTNGKRSKTKFFEKFGSKSNAKAERKRQKRLRVINDSFSNSSSALPSRVLPAITLNPARLSSASSMSSLGLASNNAYEMQGLAQRNSNSTGIHELLSQARLAVTEQSGAPPIPAPLLLSSLKGLVPATHASVQTSMTDLSTIAGGKTADNSPQGKVTTGTQFEKPVSSAATTTNSSSQNESQPLQHIEPNVVRINVTHGSSEDSVPSSYDMGGGVSLSTTMLALGGKENQAVEAPLVFNRGRRGGLIGGGEGMMLVKPGSLVQELELRGPPLVESSSTS